MTLGTCGFFGVETGAAFWSKDALEGIRDDEEGYRALRKTVRRFAEFLKQEGHRGG